MWTRGLAIIMRRISILRVPFHPSFYDETKTLSLIKNGFYLQVRLALRNFMQQTTQTVEVYFRHQMFLNFTALMFIQFIVIHNFVEMQIIFPHTSTTSTIVRMRVNKHNSISSIILIFMMVCTKNIL